MPPPGINVPPSALTLMGKLYNVILNPIIALLFSVAFVYFIWGVVRYIWNGDQDKVREDGRKAMLWGIIGMFIMFSVFGIIRIVLNTFGIDSFQALNNV